MPARVGKRVREAKGGTYGSLVVPDQTLAGHYLLRSDNAGPAQTIAGKERHAAVTNAEALAALRETNGRVVLAAFGLNKGTSGSPVDKKDNVRREMAWRNAVVTNSQRDVLEKRLEENVQAVAQFKSDLQAKFRASHGGKYDASSRQTVAAWTRQYEQKLLVDTLNIYMTSKGNSMNYTRIHSVSFANSPLPKKGK